MMPSRLRNPGIASMFRLKNQTLKSSRPSLSMSLSITSSTGDTPFSAASSATDLPPSMW